jgi:transposase
MLNDSLVAIGTPSSDRPSRRASAASAAASRQKDSYYKAQFNRLRGRHGAKKAICAVAASMLSAIYHILKDGTEHHDLGASHFDRRSTAIKARRLAAQIAKLGFEVEIRPLPVQAA